MKFLYALLITLSLVVISIVCTSKTTPSEQFIISKSLQTSTISKQIKLASSKNPEYTFNTNDVSLVPLLNRGNVKHNNYRLSIKFPSGSVDYLIHVALDFATQTTQNKALHQKAHLLDYNRFIILQHNVNSIGLAPELFSIKNDVCMYEWLNNYSVVPSSEIDQVLGKVAMQYSTLHSLNAKQTIIAAEKLMELQTERIAISPSAIVKKRMELVTSTSEKLGLNLPIEAKYLYEQIAAIEQELKKAFEFSEKIEDYSIIYNNGHLSNFLFEKAGATVNLNDMSRVARIKRKGISRESLFIDFEYAGLFYDKFYDLANFAVANSLTIEQEQKLLADYVKLNVGKAQNEKMQRALDDPSLLYTKHKLYKLMVQIMDSSWALTQQVVLQKDVLGSSKFNKRSLRYWSKGLDTLKRVNRVINSKKFQLWRNTISNL